MKKINSKMDNNIWKDYKIPEKKKKELEFDSGESKPETIALELDSWKFMDTVEDSTSPVGAVAESAPKYKDNFLPVNGNEVRPIIPHTAGWLEVKLSEDLRKKFWEICDQSKKDNNILNHQLAGNISNSYLHNNNNGEYEYLMKELLYPLSMLWLKNTGEHPRIKNLSCISHNDFNPKSTGLELYLDELWSNYQKKHEFNPGHYHSGVYSFVVWLKIPYDYKEQCKLDFMEGIKETDKKPGVFEFRYITTLGQLTSYHYKLDKSYEGTLLFFPSELQHEVFPFFDCDEERISLSGNIKIRSSKQKEGENNKKKDIKVEGWTNL